MEKNNKEVNYKLELSSEQMREIGYKAIDLLVSHYEELPKETPVAKADRASMDWLLNEPMPEIGEDPLSVMEHVEKNVLKNCASLNHPRFFSFVPSPSNFISVIADTLATGFNVFSGAWVSSPGAAEIEILTINWLLKLFGLPVREGGGLFLSGGSMANLTALAVARKAILNNEIENAVVYYSDQTHSSVDRALIVLGFKKKNIKRLSSNTNLQIPLSLLQEEIKKDKENGKKPFCVIANAGTTNAGVVDPLSKIAILCRQEKMWMHVDAAYGGAAILSEKGQSILSGIELADSITVDPHKWFYQPYEIGCVLVRNYEWLYGAFKMNPEYLKDIQGSSEEVNFYDHGVQLTRRFRALKFYMSVKTFGLKSFREAVRYNMQLAEKTQSYLQENANWEIISPATLAIINFRYKPNGLSLSEEELNKLNQQISTMINENGNAMLVTTILFQKKVLRMCLINPRTLWEDVKTTIEVLESYANKVILGLK